MAGRQQMNWLILAVMSYFAAGVPSISTGNIACPNELLEITGGSFVLSQGFSDGSHLKYTCPDGYYPSVSSRRCLNGFWTPETSTRTPKCIKVTCPNFQVLKSGVVIPSQERYYVNDTIRISCSDSERLSHLSKVRVCKPNGKWSGSTPICGLTTGHCPNPGVPPGAVRSGEQFNIGNKVTYSCERELTLIGSNERVCQDGGQWSGTEPECYAYFTYDDAEEAAEVFSSSLKTIFGLAELKQNEEEEEKGELLSKRIQVNKPGKIDIYILFDASEHVTAEDFTKAKNVAELLIDKISYYTVAPNYEILMFAADVTRINSMQDFKRGEDARGLTQIIESLNSFQYQSQLKGANIAKAFGSILDSMTLEKSNDKESFLETQHLIIVFTNGIAINADLTGGMLTSHKFIGVANMGGNPKPKVDEIKQLFQNDQARRQKLDIFVFGIGDDVNIADMNGLFSLKENEKHFFRLRDLEEFQKTIEPMLDESTFVELCGIHQSDDNSNKREAYPWLAKVQTGSSHCMGSLVSPSYIVTSATCLSTIQSATQIQVKLDNNQVVKVKHYIVHPDFNITSKQKIGIMENYEFDIGLIRLKEPVKMSPKVRPICIPCTKETNSALKIPNSKGTCKEHEEMLMNNELVEAFFTSTMTDGGVPRRLRNITIKQGKYRDSCVRDAKNVVGRPNTDPYEVVTENVLCSGGTEPRVDDIACRGESGGATYVNRMDRVVQIGIVSWGLKELCRTSLDAKSDRNSRDYHTNLFSPRIQSFLREHLGDETIERSLNFL